MNSFSTTIGRQIETIEAKDAFRDLNQCKELVPLKDHTQGRHFYIGIDFGC